MARIRASSLPATVAVASFLLLYWPVLTGLVHDWIHDGNYSHGFVIVPFAVYFAWERRHRLARANATPALGGLAVVLGGLGLLLVGRLGADLFLTRFSVLIVLVGAIAFIAGWVAVRILAFPLGFLLLMIPLPAIVFNQVTFPLQLLASRVGEAGLASLHIPVLREGNLIVLARTTLEVAEACSGIRSLVSLLTLGIIYGYFLDRRLWVRAVVAVSTVPVAILVNGLRVAGTGVAAHYLGAQTAQGFLHTFSGWLVFVVALGLLFLVTSLILWAAPPAPPSAFPSNMEARRA